MVLLAGPDGGAWCDAAHVTAARLHIELKAHRIAPDSEYSDPEQRWPEQAGMHADGALLVRPDGIVAWRAKTGADEPQHLLEQVFSTLLA
jgi:putative polyketide hydroxylase